jgi:hypothetical protein
VRVHLYFFTFTADGDAVTLSYQPVGVSEL